MTAPNTLIWLIVLLVTATPASSAVTVFLTRHAERAGGGAMGNDDPLSPAGRERADLLARMLADSGIQTILVTQYKRTHETAAPLARKLGIPPRQIPEVAATVAAIRAVKSGAVLVAGHSNTLPEIIAGLGGPSIPKIAEDEYDNLYVLTISGTDVSLVRLHYGAPRPLPRIALVERASARHAGNRAGIPRPR
jgi:phosphohistidine phosphatase SixA